MPLRAFGIFRPNSVVGPRLKIHVLRRAGEHGQSDDPCKDVPEKAEPLVFGFRCVLLEVFFVAFFFTIFLAVLVAELVTEL